MTLFRGSAVAIITPFTHDGDVDYNSLAHLIEFQIENHTDAIVIVGTTGEASTLTDEEQADVVRFTVEKVNRRIPVIAGAGSNDTRHGINLAKLCEAAGADGLLQVTPYYNKTSQAGLIAHFNALANAVQIPTILYNVPGRTGMTIQPHTVAELAKNEKIVGIKDATGDLGYTALVKSVVPDHFSIYSGNDDVVVPILSLGGDGVISVWANICPKEVHEMCQAFFDGDTKKAAKLQVQYKAFIDALFMETNPIPIKAAMNLAGMNAGSLRLPLVEAQENTKQTLSHLMKELGIL